MQKTLQLFLFISSQPVFASDDSGSPIDRDSGAWKLVHEEVSLADYRRSSPTSTAYEIRIHATINASMNHVVEILTDVSAYKYWVYKCSEARLLSTPAPGEQIYYARTAFPWPLGERGLFLHSVSKRDDKTGVFMSTSTVVSRYLESSEGVLRISEFSSSWKVSPSTNNTVLVDYRVKYDPGGGIPDWAVNTGIASGPRKTIEALQKLVMSTK